MAHKTNYKDALFEQRKYRMQNNPDGTVTPIDETDYTQEGDRIGALELNKIGEALNALEQEMGKRELQTYTALSQLSLEAPVTLSQLITAMPDGSYAAIDCNGTSVVSDIPSGSAAGSLEVVKVGDSGSAKYTNTSNGQVYFWGNGQWYAALVDEMVLGTMEEIDANTDAGKVAGALAVKELSSDLSGLSFGQDAEGNWGYIPSGADAVIPFSSQVIGQAIWGNINAANKGYTQVDIGFRPKKLIGYTVDASNPSTLAIEVIYFNIWGNDDIVHRRAVSRYYDEVMGDDPNRLVITDTGFTMYNSGGLWVGKTFYYMAFRT